MFFSMNNLINALILLFLIKSIPYVFFPSLVQIFYAERIVDCNKTRLRLFGFLMMVISGVIAWLYYL
jgi:uncharacterized protein YjeT (DUF2065 family)